MYIWHANIWTGVIFLATQLWRQKLVVIAKNFPDLTFAIADEDDQSDVFKQFGFEDSGEELNIGIIDSNDKKYPMEDMEEYDAEAINDFLTAFTKGELVFKIL